MFTKYIFFYPFTFNLSWSSRLKCIYWVMFLLLIHSANLWLLIDVLKPFTFKEIVYMLGLKYSILLSFFCVFTLLFVPHFPLSYLPMLFLRIFWISLWFIYSVIEYITMYHFLSGSSVYHNMHTNLLQSIEITFFSLWKKYRNFISNEITLLKTDSQT